MTAHAACHALLVFAYNTSPQALAAALFPGCHPVYIDEWAGRFADGITRAAGHMDEETFGRLVDLAVARYGAEAKLRFP